MKIGIEDSVTIVSDLARYRYMEDHGYGAHYVKLQNAGPPPYLRQVRVEAILDVDADGRLAGIEIVDDRAPPPRDPVPGTRVIVEVR